MLKTQHHYADLVERDHKGGVPVNYQVLFPLLDCPSIPIFTYVCLVLAYQLLGQKEQQHFTHTACQGFYRLCIFSKEAIDRYSLRNTISFQVTASSVQFFTMQLEFPFLYTVTELARLRIPTRKCDLLDLMGRVDNLLFVASLY
ncbi:hypothetical protein RO3G_08791 [Rhizopus delemar RA 99-880]|uniref:Uncharacterized protein n=1 Tax=Rhizopus delemar (strain RA 99-880 / ATCC MYA-4621 / FGSC 9543 / NRRL 43880) TaxID=246409 RepID=I1C6K6_RHIO9|nr:hypothetical protein RO3G_08791 [Rhizopus delemar RA 99-880]|eukprot:EIE84086.1 hypothetical protein RO3G_08791 [Rhizopus delemar RA 99-880]